MRDFKVGDRVWHPEYGWGTITGYDERVARGYVLYGDDEYTHYVGWWELFYDEVDLPNPPKPKVNKRSKNGYWILGSGAMGVYEVVDIGCNAHFEGSLSDCYHWIKAKEAGYL